VVAEIVRGLYDGVYVAGQKLTEADLMWRFGVGRGSVREALRRMEAEGLITISLHRGASIRALSRYDVRDILEVIEALSGLAARLAAERISRPEDEKALRESLGSLSKIAESGDAFQFARMRNRFYRQLAHVSGNRELARLIPSVQAHMVRVQFRSAYEGSAVHNPLVDYQRVIEAVLERNGTRAERTMRQHIRATARAIEQLPDHHFSHTCD
jgi:DNA-binding GntR family transcriptional regulator